MILDRAEEVFAKRGYKDVTMKDIAEACGISRGGLYLYYPGTEELFLDVLDRALERSDEELEKSLAKYTDAEKILRVFLEEQKKELFEEKRSLHVAASEFSFAHRSSGRLRTRFDEAVRVLEFLIRMGIRQNSFRCRDPHSAAVNIMFIIEGWKSSVYSIRLQQREADNEIGYIMDVLRGKC